MLLTYSMQFFVHDSNIIINILLLYYICSSHLKHSLQNHLKILKTYFLSTTCTCLAHSNLQSHNIILPVAIGLNDSIGVQNPILDEVILVSLINTYNTQRSIIMNTLFTCQLYVKLCCQQLEVYKL